MARDAREPDDDALARRLALELRAECPAGGGVLLLAGTTVDDPDESSRPCSVDELQTLFATAAAAAADGRAWYADAVAYWARVPPSLDGMLGGYERISPADAAVSRRFLHTLFGPSLPHPARALDCGAGIGRVAKDVLLPAGFAPVDLVEQSAEFLAHARQFVAGGDAAAAARLGDLVCEALQRFVPQHRYALVWAQWVTGYLTDADFVRLFARLRAALQPHGGGWIVLKENVTRSSQFVVDASDSSVIRSDAHTRRLLVAAGLTLVHVREQTFPNLFPVRIYAAQ